MAIDHTKGPLARLHHHCSKGEPVIEQPAWFTNDPETALTLRAIDNAYAAARSKAENLPLAEKVEAYRAARLARETAYADIRGDAP